MSIKENVLVARKGRWDEEVFSPVEVDQYRLVHLADGQAYLHYEGRMWYAQDGVHFRKMIRFW